MYNDRNNHNNRNRDDRQHHSRGGRGRQGVPLSDLDPALTEVSRKVIGCAIEVHKGLGPGFDKSVYAEALKGELDAMGVKYKASHPVSVTYKGREVGTRVADLVVEDRFVVELMAQRGEVGGAERAALRALLRVMDMELGLIINFAERWLKDGLVRVLNPDKLNLKHADEEAGYEDDHGNGQGGSSNGGSTGGSDYSEYEAEERQMRGAGGSAAGPSTWDPDRRG